MARYSKDRIVVDLSSDSDDDVQIRSNLHPLPSLRRQETPTSGRKRPWPFVVASEKGEEAVKRRVLTSGACPSLERRGDGSSKESSCSSSRQNEGKGVRDSPWDRDRDKDSEKERERGREMEKRDAGGESRGGGGYGKGKKECSGGKKGAGGKSCEESSDDDFMMFDKDPNIIEGNEKEIRDDEEEEEMVIVGERVTVACRDFPHARHSCVTYPFSTTAHKDHCHLCHCFVCDCLAPCPSWGTGSKTGDHCNASDVEESWKLMRKLYKARPPQPFSGPDPSLNLWPPQPNTNLSLGRSQRSTNGKATQPTIVVGNQRNRHTVTRSSSTSQRGNATANLSRSSTGDRQSYQVNMCLSLSLDVPSSHRGVKQLQSGKEGRGENTDSLQEGAMVLSPGSKQPDKRCGKMVRGVLLDESRRQMGDQSARLSEKNRFYKEGGVLVSMALRGGVCGDESELSAGNKEKYSTEFTSQMNASSLIAKRAQSLLNKIYAPTESSASSSKNGTTILEVGGQENESILESANRYEADTEPQIRDKNVSLFERHTNEVMGWCDSPFDFEDYLHSKERHVTPFQDKQDIPMELDSSGSVGYREESHKEPQPVFNESTEKTFTSLLNRPTSPSQPPLPPTTPPPSPPPLPPSAPPPLEEYTLNATCTNHSGIGTDTSGHFMNTKTVEQTVDQTVEISSVQREVVKSAVPENSTEPVLQLMHGAPLTEWNRTAYYPSQDAFQPSDQNDPSSSSYPMAYPTVQHPYPQDQLLQSQQVNVYDTVNDVSVPFYGYQHGTQQFIPWTQQQPFQPVTTEAYSSNPASVSAEVYQPASVNQSPYNPLEAPFWQQREGTEEEHCGNRLPWDSNNGAVGYGEGNDTNGGFFPTCSNVPLNTPWGVGSCYEFGYPNVYGQMAQMAPPQGYSTMGQSGPGPYDAPGAHMGNANIHCDSENLARRNSNDCWSYGGEVPVYPSASNVPNIAGSHVPVNGNGGWGTWV